MSQLKDFYNNEVIPKLKEQFKYSNSAQIPRLEKVVLNMGLGEAIHNNKLLWVCHGACFHLHSRKATQADSAVE